MSTITTCLGVALRRSGHPEHDTYSIVGTGGQMIVTDTGNGGETAYALLFRDRRDPDTFDTMGEGPDLESVVRVYLAL